jgi:predicted PurR-regulated permease PerM
LTTALSSAVGMLTSTIMVLVIGIFIAMEPKLYDRGVAWMLPTHSRHGFYELSNKIGFTLRRLMFGRIVGMVVEGVGTWLLLLAGGVPMAALLGLLTGLLAFVPNIGAIISGVLMVAVGFSAGTDAGLWAIATYLIVQTVDGYVIVPYVARRTVDLAPALVLGAQILFGTLFGIIGLLLADPIVAMIKVALERESERGSKAELRSAVRLDTAAAQRRRRRSRRWLFLPQRRVTAHPAASTRTHPRRVHFRPVRKSRAARTGLQSCWSAWWWRLAAASAMAACWKASMVRSRTRSN